MKVLCKSSNKFLIKDEWYQVQSTHNLSPDGYCQINYTTLHYQLINHTDKKWNTNWYHESNFYTIQELREIKLEQIL